MKPRRNYNKRGSLCLSSVEGFGADVKADFLTAGSAQLQHCSLQQMGCCQDELAGRGLGLRWELNVLLRGVLQCIYSGENVGVHQSPPQPFSVAIPGALQSRDIPCLCRKPGLDACMLQACKSGSLRKGKLR